MIRNVYKHTVHSVLSIFRRTKTAATHVSLKTRLELHLKTKLNIITYDRVYKS